jgi:opacity protein-like surface antigen
VSQANTKGVMVMTSMVTRIAAVLVVVGLVTAALPTSTAAQNLFIGFSYGMGIPTGDTKEFIGNTSFRGMAFDWRKLVGERVSAGFHIGWSVFDEETLETASRPGVDVTGKQFRYINAFPILANFYYYLGNNRSFRPYIGGEAGAYIIEQRLEVGLYALEEHNWHFGLAPAGGVSFPLSDEMFTFVNARYNYAFKSGNTIDHSWWSINIGIGSASYSF